VSKSGRPLVFSPTDLSDWRGDEITPDQLRDLLARACMGQRQFAREVGIDEREFRYMCAGQMAVPKVIVLALQQLAGVRRV
jgi:hypothetical protein